MKNEKRQNNQENNPLAKLIEIMDRLRGTDGCPWDKEQTRDSLKPYLVEEAYEVIDAIESRSPDKIKEELGDLLYQIIFHSRIAKEKNEFDMYDVITSIIEKMVRRHPHVFSDSTVKDTNEVLVKWERIKNKENGNLKKNSVLDGIPNTMPALLKAKRLQEKAARYNFDWSNFQDVFLKIKEEIIELEDELNKKEDLSIDAVEHELGDILFAIVNLSRFINIDPETSLRKASERFTRRFNYIEKKLKVQGISLKDSSLKEMEALWNEAKKNN